MYSSMRATGPAHLNRLDLRFIIVLCEEYNAFSSVLCTFLHSKAILSLLAQLTFLALYSRTLYLLLMCVCVCVCVCVF